MIGDFLDGKVAEAAEMQQRIFPLLRIMGQNRRVNPVAIWKEAMRLGGLDGGIPRLPFTRGTETEVEEIKTVMEPLGLLQLQAKVDRSEERRVGKACVRTCRSRRSLYHSKKQKKHAKSQ